MSIDGRLFARARDELEERKQKNEQEHQRREREVYARLPQVKALDGELRRLFTELVSASLRQNGGGPGLLKTIDEKSLALRARRAELLIRAGYPEDYLDDIYSCRECRDSGFLRSGRPCACLMKLYAGQQARELSSLLKLGEDEFSDFDLSYYPTETDPAYGVSPRDCMELVYSTCRTFAESFGKDSPNLLFRGGTGLGKTFLSACIAKAVAAKGFSVVYETAAAAFEAFEDRKFGRGGDAEEKVERILGCDLLILDDLGTEMNTQFSQSALYTIVNSRLSSGKKTIISTNLSARELAARYPAQIASRIEGEYDVQLFLGQDIRAIKKEKRYH